MSFQFSDARRFYPGDLLYFENAGVTCIDRPVRWAFVYEDTRNPDADAWRDEEGRRLGGYRSVRFLFLDSLDTGVIDYDDCRDALRLWSAKLYRDGEGVIRDFPHARR